MNIPRIVIAGTNSGCGKTTVSMGIMAALVGRGMCVQPYKAGPDYIDPMLHTFITGCNSRNLDSWLLDDSTLKYLFNKNSCKADIAVIEGVMGLYDGALRNSDNLYDNRCPAGSTAYVAKTIDSPVVLVVNARGMSLSTAAVIKGFKDFDSDVSITGVVLNNVNSERHYNILKQMITESLEHEANSPSVIGYLPTADNYSLNHRHLGLLPAQEIQDLKTRFKILGEQVEKTIEIDRIISMANRAFDAGKSTVLTKGITIPECERVRIAVAKDRAFNFYYQDNLDLLEDMNAELVYFSPLNDKKLPDGIDGIYLCGGYPEVYAEQLQNNHSMKSDLKNKILNNMPVVAECGGMMYLCSAIEYRGQRCEMVGIIPAVAEMTNSLQKFGYVDVSVEQDNVLSKMGDRIRAHEFHYSMLRFEKKLDDNFCYKISKNNFSWKDGIQIYNVVGAYAHLHFWSNIDFAKNFLKSCSKSLS